MLRAPTSAPSALIFDLSEPLLASQIDDQPRTRLRRPVRIEVDSLLNNFCPWRLSIDSRYELGGDTRRASTDASSERAQKVNPRRKSLSESRLQPFNPENRSRIRCLA